MLPIVIVLVGAMVPVLAQEVAKLLIGSAIEKEAKKRAWVIGFVADLHPLLDKWMPSIAKPAEDELLELVEAALNEALDKIEGPNSADTQTAALADSTGAELEVKDAAGNPVPTTTKS